MGHSYGTISPITLERPTLLETSKGVSLSYTLYRTPTRQTCKTVIILYYIVYKYLCWYTSLIHLLKTDVLSYRIVNIHRYSPTLRWLIVLLYTKPGNSQRLKKIFGQNSRARPLCFANQWISRVWVANQKTKKTKHYSLVWYILTTNIDSNNNKTAAATAKRNKNKRDETT